jgi:hypothetical protein
MSSPVGNTPLKMVQTGNDPFTNSYSSGVGAWKLAPAAAGQTWTVSVWVKASQVIQVEGCWVAEQDAAGNYLAGGGSPNVTIGTTWTRISGTYTLVNALTAFVGLRLDGTQSGGAGVTLWWDGLQLERASLASTFNSKTNINGNTWYDLSGKNNNVTLYNNPVFSNNKLTFNGSNQYGRTSSTLNLTPYSSITTLVGMRTTSAVSGMLFEHTANWNSNAGGFGLNPHSNGSGQAVDLHHTNHNTGSARNYQYAIGTNWNVHGNVFSRVVDTSGRIAYGNGAQLPFSTTGGYGTDNASPAGSFATDYFYIASRGGTGSFLPCEISFIIIYGRKLSNTEISQHFAAHRSRYGI